MHNVVYANTTNTNTTNTNTTTVTESDKKWETGIIPRLTNDEKKAADRFTIPIEGRPQESLAVNIDAGDPMVSLLSTIQKILLRLVLPVVAVGCGIYIAYNLFTAEGDESKMATTWRAILYSVIAIVAIGLSALLVGVISWLNIG